MFSIKHKRIVITGGSAGIGLAIAKSAARAGAEVALIARNEMRLNAAVSQITDLGGRAHPIPCDVCDSRAVAEAIEQAIAAMGGLDGIVANSGFCRPGVFHEIPVDALQSMVQTNLMGSINILHAAIPYLLDADSSFAVITSSPAGNASIYGFNVYGATKAALNHLAHGLRAEYADKGLRVLTLLPPDTDTPGYQEEIAFYPPETRAILESGTLHSAEAVAEACLRAIETGQNRVVVGGETKFLLPFVRHAPRLWEAYCHKIIKKTRRETKA